MSNTSKKFSSRRRRGSALITSIIFGTIILFGIAGVLPMLMNDWKQTTRTSLQEAAFALAESGIEESLWAFMEYGDDEAEWTTAGWSESSDGKYWYREWTLTSLSQSSGVILDLDDGRTGLYRAIVEKTGDTKLTIVAQGYVSGVTNASGAKRYIETEIDNPFTTSNPIAYGLIARRGMELAGQPSFDSYNSDFGENPGSGLGSRTNVTVGGPSVTLSDFSTTNAQIYGNARAGTPDGSTHPFAGNVVTGSRIYDFTMDFPEIDKPDTSVGTWNNSL